MERAHGSTLVNMSTAGSSDLAFDSKCPSSMSIRLALRGAVMRVRRADH